MTATFALFRNKDTGEQRVIEAHGNNMAVGAELAELASKAVKESHLLVVWTTKETAMTRPAWNAVWETFVKEEQGAVEAENAGGNGEVYLVIGKTIAEGEKILADFRRRFAARLN